MRIWIDADACPKPIKEILIRAAHRTKIEIIFVANQLINITPSAFIKRVQVSPGFDVADNYIVQNISAGDLVITADIPLADAVIDKAGVALSPRGVLFSKENIKQCLAMRNFGEELRNSGVNTGGPAPLGPRDIQDFANKLDQQLKK